MTAHERLRSGDRRILPEDQYPAGSHFVKAFRAGLFAPWRITVYRDPSDPYVIKAWRYWRRSDAEAKFWTITASDAHLEWQEAQQARLLAWNRDARYVGNG